MKKFNIRYGTSLAPLFSKDLDAITPNLANFENVKLVPMRRIKKSEENDGQKKLKRPSISAILGSIGDKKGLYLWQKNMIDEMGLAGFRKTMTDRLTLGVKIHSHIEKIVKIRGAENYQEKEIYEYIDKEKDVMLKNYMKSALPYVFSLETSKNAILEKYVKHFELGYQGRFDAVIPSSANSLQIVDWKTSPARSTFSTQKEESMSYATYVKQLAAYASAFNHDTNFENFNFVKTGLLVSLNEDGSPAELYQVSQEDLERTFEEFKNELIKFWEKIDGSPGRNIDFAYKP